MPEQQLPTTVVIETFGGNPATVVIKNDGSLMTTLKFLSDGSVRLYNASDLELMTINSEGGVVAMNVETGGLTATAGDIVVSEAGRGLKVAEGADAKMGTATLVNGTVTVTNTNVTGGSRIFLTNATPNGVILGLPCIMDVQSGVDFTISSLDPAGAVVTADNSVINWFIVEPA